ncbi:MAG: GNAT family N-acetyltransferase [Candidatus Rokubacteria bacterium]|nr:GNAT family N-acetyltransferase [Candidatus Rokubacteria bacterium]
MLISTITTRTELDALAPEWNDLLQASRADTIFLTWEYISAWLDAAASSAELHVLAVRDQSGNLVGIAPFYRRQIRLCRVLTHRCLCILGEHASPAEYLDLILHRDQEQPVLDALGAALARRSDWDCIWIPKVAGWTGAPERLTRLARSAGLHVWRRDSSFSAIELPPEVDQYMRLLSTKMRYQMRRGIKQLNESGAITFEQCRSREQLPLFIDNLERLHQKHWASAGEPGGFRRNPSFRAFVETICDRAIEKGWISLSSIRVNDICVAVQFAFTYHGTFSAIQEGFDPDFKTVTEGIGNVLRCRTIQQCIEAGLTCYDFLGGETWHKQRWAAQMRQGFDFFIHRRSVKTLPLRVRPVWPTGRHMAWHLDGSTSLPHPTTQVAATN